MLSIVRYFNVAVRIAIIHENYHGTSCEKQGTISIYNQGKPEWPRPFGSPWPLHRDKALYTHTHTHTRRSLTGKNPADCETAQYLYIYTSSNFISFSLSGCLIKYNRGLNSLEWHSFITCSYQHDGAVFGYRCNPKIARHQKPLFDFIVACGVSACNAVAPLPTVKTKSKLLEIQCEWGLVEILGFIAWNGGDSRNYILGIL